MVALRMAKTFQFDLKFRIMAQYSIRFDSIQNEDSAINCHQVCGRAFYKLVYCVFRSAQLPLIHTICVEWPSIQTEEQWH